MSLGRPSTLLNPSEALLQPSNDCGRNKNSMDRTVERVGGVEEHTSKVVAVLRFMRRDATGVVAVLCFMRRDATGVVAMLRFMRCDTTGKVRESCLPMCAHVSCVRVYAGRLHSPSPIVE